MRSRLPPLNPLRAFEATARHATVAKAAEELNVTASAVSHQVRVLEESLGVDLFIRSRARLKLTPAGEALLPSVRGAFEMIATAVAKVGETVVAGDLVVSAPLSFTSRWLARHIGDFLHRYPAIKLKLIPSNDDKEVYSPDVDVCIRYGEAHWKDRSVTLIEHPSLYPVVSPALMNGPKAIRSPDDLRHYALFCEHAGSWMRWLMEAKVEHPERMRILEIGNAHIAVEAALHGQGVALGDSISVRDDLVEGTLVRPFKATVPSRHPYHIVRPPERAESPLASVFVFWLEQQLSEST
ncbi:LysR family transcriptional regulator [Caballeronia megalochromosomata]|nr:LysR family transcriptional regulator [Caballeronia megalochromosomata]